MARAFAKISFTANVQAVQSEMGSHTAYQGAELGALETVVLGEAEQAFIAERDSFYQATVSQTGLPYVQHRGGPAGFLRVLDEYTLGYADFSGNRQYMSVGNLRGDDRVSLILMDYPRRLRLKIWGRARAVDERTEPELLRKLELPDSRAPVERGILIRVEAFDWNCPKYIAPRYSQQEVAALMAQVRRQPEAMEKSVPRALGTGAIPLTITGIRQVTPTIRAYELSHAEGGVLPDYRAGAHLRVPILLPDGSVSSRAYSLTDAPGDSEVYRIAVLRVDDGEGGSRALQDGWNLGTQIRADPPENYFPLHKDDRPTVLIAGGIGITPIKAMVETLDRRGANFELHYTGRTLQDMAYRGLVSETPRHARLRRHVGHVAGLSRSSHHNGAKPMTSEIKAPVPPFTAEAAAQKVRMAEDAWNSRDPDRVALVYTEDTLWRNRAEFPQGREQVRQFLQRKWARELDYRLIKELWAYTDNRIAVRFAYEWHDDSGQWFRSYGNENWEFNPQGLMQRRFASINDLPITPKERLFHWPLGARPVDHPSLSELGL